MKLSIVIVNHNECALLKQAVSALTAACLHIDYELIIVDNASTDGSIKMLETGFPTVKVIANTTDQGLAKSNNQGLRLCSGQYVLVVTPDTKCGKDSLEKAIAFMDDHNDAGGLSIRLLSPQGRFIPESIHGLSPVWASFFKLIGFAKNLAKTRLYDRNRKDWVEEFQITEIDIINGACMLLRNSALIQTGLFDERFFMYGYDIDLSYRIRLAGFKNFYFPKTYFFKYKDESSPKISWSYIRHFYGAMAIFAVKYLFRLPEIKVRPVAQLYTSSLEVKG